MGQTLVEKIAQRFSVGLSGGDEVRSGDYISIQPLHVMTHDNTAAVISKFRAIGARKMHDPDQPVFVLDHDIQNQSPENLEKYARIHEFACDFGVAFYPAGRGIGHQVMIEEAFVLPGSLVVGADSHSNLYGALGALETPVVRTDAAAIWATGRTWWQVPDVVRVNLHGRLQAGVTGRDVITTLIGTFHEDQVLNCCVEFAGPGVSALDLGERLTIANMTTEWGALAGVFPYDQVARDYLDARAEFFKFRGDVDPRLTPRMISQLAAHLPTADSDAVYVRELDFDLTAVTPFVAGPNDAKAITPLAEIERQGVRVDKAFLMSCVNARLADFQAAADVVRGKRVADHVEFYIAGASSEVEELARERGYWRTLVEAGAIALPPGCGACIGLGAGVLQPGEVAISATSRNFEGGMGSRDALIYLASPVVVAASAVAGRIAGPRREQMSPAQPRQRLERGSAQEPRGRPGRPALAVEVVADFPEMIEGALLLVPRENLNTDGIYGKEYTYRDEMTPEAMARVVMAGYDPAFRDIAQAGDILVGGYNFGCGSSREQAVTALEHFGVQMIIAGSFAQMYKRNAFNNGYICIECPELVDALRAAHQGDAALTIRTGLFATVDFTRSQIELRSPDAENGKGGGSARPKAAAPRTFAFMPLGLVAQELVVQGGLAAVIRDQLAKVS